MDEQEAQQELRESMNLHLRQRAQEAIDKYGKLTYTVLQRILQDRKFVRYPVSLIFDSTQIEPGLFAKTEMRLLDGERQPHEDDDYRKQVDRSFDLILHEQFEGEPDKLLPLILYHLPAVNYGDIATFEDSEVFGSAMMQIPPDEYYQLVCELADTLPSS